MKIIKRDSRVKDFDVMRIKSAIKRAYTDVYGDDEKYKSEYKKTMTQNIIVQDIENLNLDPVPIEKVQDIVISNLYKLNKDVAICYEDYREERRIQRDKNSSTYKKLDSIIKCDDIMNSNANVDENSFGGRKLEAANVPIKNYTLDMLIPRHLAKAHRENRLYLHDLDSYAVGMHNCSFVDLKKLLNNGFTTRNGDVRGANSISTAMQLIAVIFQIQSQEQFGGVGSCHIDYDLEEVVNTSFRKYYSKGLKLFADKEIKYRDLIEEINIENIEDLKKNHVSELDSKILNYALSELEEEGLQSAQALYHNLNTLESRPGSQVPFTSINYGRRTTVAGRMVDKWLLQASLEGIGRFHKTSIFPISILQYKQGINSDKGDPNYDIKKLAIKSMSKRIYPNWVNCDWSGNVEDPNNPDTVMSTMGCRTLVGFDRNGMGYSKVGRGNVSPVTINLVKIAIKHGICLGEREKADIDGFIKELEETIDLAIEALLFRFNHICKQSAKSAPFMYKNKSMLGWNGEDLASEEAIRETMKHGSQAIGYAGIAEMCQAMYGKDHSDDESVWTFAYAVVNLIKARAEQASEKYDLNFTPYAAPIESTCGTIVTGNREVKGLREEFGIIKNVTDRDWITNSHHVPVWKEVSIKEKLRLEAPFTKLATGGCITYVELDSAIIQNPKAIESIIDYAFKELDIPYLAFNFPIDTCLDCGFQGEFNDSCAMCGSKNIEQLRRVTGYLTTDYHHFNKAKQAEVKARFKHSKIKTV